MALLRALGMVSDRRWVWAVEDTFFFSFFLFSIFFLFAKIWKGDGSSGKSCGTEREMTPTYKIQGTGEANRGEQR